MIPLLLNSIYDADLYKLAEITYMRNADKPDPVIFDRSCVHHGKDAGIVSEINSFRHSLFCLGNASYLAGQANLPEHK